MYVIGSRSLTLDLNCMFASKWPSNHTQNAIGTMFSHSGLSNMVKKWTLKFFCKFNNYYCRLYSIEIPYSSNSAGNIEFAVNFLNAIFLTLKGVLFERKPTTYARCYKPFLCDFLHFCPFSWVTPHFSPAS